MFSWFKKKKPVNIHQEEINRLKNRIKFHKSYLHHLSEYGRDMPEFSNGVVESEIESDIKLLKELEKRTE